MPKWAKNWTNLCIAFCILKPFSSILTEPQDIIMDLTTPFPTGSWTLYYHDPSDTKWTLESYKQIVSFNTLGQYFAIMKELGDISTQYGMIFCMRGNIPPLYENSNNIRGGCYSLRIVRNKSSNFFHYYAIACFMGQAVQDKENEIQGISISPKRIMEKNQSFNVIKVWNKDCQKYNKGGQLAVLGEVNTLCDIIYTPHIEKKL